MNFSSEERKILYLILHYYSNPRISELLKCSLSTTKNKIRIIFAKAQARNRLELFKNYYSNQDKFEFFEEEKKPDEILEYTPNFGPNP